MATNYQLITPGAPYPLGEDANGRPRVSFIAQVDKDPSGTMLDEIAAFLVANGVAVPLTKAKMPGAPDVVATLYEYAGPPDERGFGIAGAKFTHPRLQVVCRGAAEDYATARANAEQIRNLLITVQARAL